MGVRDLVSWCMDSRWDSNLDVLRGEMLVVTVYTQWEMLIGVW